MVVEISLRLEDSEAWREKGRSKLFGRCLADASGYADHPGSLFPQPRLGECLECRDCVRHADEGKGRAGRRDVLGYDRPPGSLGEGVVDKIAAVPLGPEGGKGLPRRGEPGG